MTRIATIVALVGLVAAPALGQEFDPNLLPGWEDDNVTQIQVTNMTGTFDPTLGDDLGQMSIEPKAGGPIVTIYYESHDPWTVPAGEDGVVWFLMNLYADGSTPPHARGRFNGDGVGNPDWQLAWNDIPVPGDPDVVFLEGNLVYFEMEEYLDTGMLAGGGRILATGGFLYGEAGWPGGDEVTSVTSFEFGVTDPNGLTLNINDFSQEFTGDFYLTFYPDDDHGIPEPATLALLGAGLGVVALRRRFR